MKKPESIWPVVPITEALLPRYTATDSLWSQFQEAEALVRLLICCNGFTHSIFILEEEEVVHVLSYYVHTGDSQECGRIVPIACQRTPKVRLPFCSLVEGGSLGGAS